jgi:hypothetical protein
MTRDGPKYWAFVKSGLQLFDPDQSKEADKIKQMMCVEVAFRYQ